MSAQHSTATATTAEALKNVACPSCAIEYEPDNHIVEDVRQYHRPGCPVAVRFDLLSAHDMSVIARVATSERIVTDTDRLRLALSGYPPLPDDAHWVQVRGARELELEHRFVTAPWMGVSGNMPDPPIAATATEDALATDRKHYRHQPPPFREVDLPDDLTTAAGVRDFDGTALPRGVCGLGRFEIVAPLSGFTTAETAAALAQRRLSVIPLGANERPLHEDPVQWITRRERIIKEFAAAAKIGVVQR